MKRPLFIKGIALNLLMTASVLFTYAETKKALFLGNSYTYFNDLPTMVSDLAFSLGDTLIYDSNTPGGVNAEAHWNNQTTRDKIAIGDWDYVVIQCQSQEPSFSPQQVEAQTFPFVQLLDSLVQATNPCAETMFFMTWGRENGDANNCANYPPVCTYEGMQDRLSESYLLFSELLTASTSPVGEVWKYIRANYPAIGLYTADGSHPSIFGSYLAASTFYSSFFLNSSESSQFYPSAIDSTEAFHLREAASGIILDSLNTWQGFGNIPLSSFDYSVTNSSVSFINSSERAANYLWDFGNGQTSTDFQPIQTFDNGVYNVCLDATNDCGTIHRSCQEIEISVVIDNINESITSDLDFYIINNQVYFDQSIATYSWKMYGLNGTLISNGMSASNPLLLDNISSGSYLLNIEQKGKTQSKVIYIE